MLVPLIFAIWIVPGDRYESVFFQISNQLKWALMGLVISIVIIGIVIIRFVPSEADRTEKKERRPWQVRICQSALHLDWAGISIWKGVMSPRMRIYG
jgi:hypothetical protein